MRSISPWAFSGAYVLDVLAGDPAWFPHPVRVMGLAVHIGERLVFSRFRTSRSLGLAGTALTGVVVSGSWISGRLAISLGLIAEVLLAWTTLAAGSLKSAVNDVLVLLESNQLQAARHALAAIVGRDTASLDETEIVRALIETIAESLCDGVIAPMLYLAAGGVPMSLAFKAVSTLDSMVGHLEAPYTYFGRFAARLDDGANFLPSRLTALLIVAAAPICGADAYGAWRTWRRDGNKHSSPNAGQCEAAMAGALSVRLGGVNYYDSALSLKPLLNHEGRPATLREGRQALKMASVVSALGFALFLLTTLRRIRSS